MINYYFDNDHDVLESVFSGPVCMKDISDFMHDINKEKNLPGILNILVDARKAKFHIDPRDIPELAAFNYKLNKRFDHINNAILTDHPEETAISLLYRLASKSSRYHVKLFSMRENAMEWLSMAASIKR